MKYKGQVLDEVKTEHVGLPFWKIWARNGWWGFGRVLAVDVGKLVIVDEGVFCIESNEQRDQRLNQI